MMIDANEIQCMKAAENNFKRNQVLERYIPPGWRKIKSDCSEEERRRWVKAKYDTLLFTFPLKIATSTLVAPQSVSPNKGGVSPKATVLPSRLCDYFAIVEPKPLLKPPEQLRQIESVKLTTHISSIYPLKHAENNSPIPELISDFIFPNGAFIQHEEKSPFFFNFILTDTNGVKLYGGCLHFYELIELDEVSKLLATDVKMFNASGHVYFVPKAITITSHYPFYHLFRVFLTIIYHVSLSSAPAPLERYIASFINEVPLPPLGKIQVNYSIANQNIYLSRPPKNQLPMVDFSYLPIFELLSIDTILLLFASMCAERSICLCSENIALLAPICESLVSFLFPFVWQGVYVPIMPLDNLEILEAPIPFLIGTHAKYLADTSPVNRPFNLVIVDIDHDKILQGNLVFCRYISKVAHRNRQ